MGNGEGSSEPPEPLWIHHRVVVLKEVARGMLQKPESAHIPRPWSAVRRFGRTILSAEYAFFVLFIFQFALDIFSLIIY